MLSSAMMFCTLCNWAISTRACLFTPSSKNVTSTSRCFHFSFDNTRSKLSCPLSSKNTLATQANLILSLCAQEIWFSKGRANGFKTTCAFDNLTPICCCVKSKLCCETKKHSTLIDKLNEQLNDTHLAENKNLSLFAVPLHIEVLVFDTLQRNERHRSLPLEKWRINVVERAKDFLQKLPTYFSLRILQLNSQSTQVRWFFMPYFNIDFVSLFLGELFN